MWLADGMGNPPSAEYLKYGPGVMCADLVAFACLDNGIDAPAGTSAWWDFLEEREDFSLETPGEVGAVCMSPYQDPYDQGHIAIYTGEHYIVQSITSGGVTNDWTDYETYPWPECHFTLYGKIPGVDYSGSTSSSPDSVSERPSWDHGAGWYEVFEDWSMTWHSSSE